MKAKQIPQYDLPGTQDAFNLAGDIGTDWDRLKRAHQDKIRDQRLAAARQVKLFDMPGLEPGSHWS